LAFFLQFGLYMSKVDTVVETPRGSAEKYSYEQESGLFRLKKILPAGMCFPYDFGFIPGTKGEDGDPLDSLVISEFKSFPGCLIECRVIGAMLAEESSKEGKLRNDRFFLVADESKVFKQLDSIKDLPEKWVNELMEFFVLYNRSEKKDFKMLELIKSKEAIKIINEYKHG
jgi:inorganic pyrophosphatase